MSTFTLGWRCANELASMVDPSTQKGQYVLHYLKGLALTEKALKQAGAYAVNGKLSFKGGN